jgi:SAM-dependent methyltransferase
VHVFLRGLLAGDFRPLRALIRRELPRERRTLDLGCGPGIFADLFSPEEYVGVDPSASFIDHARRARPGIFLLADLSRVPLPDGRFDQVLIVERLHPLAEGDARALLAEARRMLVGGGRALVVERVKGALDLAGRVRERLGRPPRATEEVERLLRAAGRILRSETISSGTGRYLATVVAKDTSPRGTVPVDSQS